MMHPGRVLATVLASLALAGVQGIMAQEVIWVLNAPNPVNTAFGASVAPGGDLDGDGHADVLIGEDAASPVGLPFAGRVHAFSGGTAMPLFTVNGSSPNDALGGIVKSVGDFDGDGVPDVGAVAFGGEYLRVFSGATTGVLQTVGGSGIRSFAGLGDVDGDGVGDLVAGFPFFSPTLAIPFGGETWVVSGGSGVILFSYQGSVSWQMVGRTVAHAGDLNGDGVPDVLVGAPTFYPTFAVSGGFVTAYSGATGGALYSVSPNPAGGDGFGISLDGGRDVTGDGIPDFIVGAPFLGFNSGAGYVYDGSDGTLVYFVNVVSPTQEMLGGWVALTGDVNVDGREDFLIAGADSFGGPPADFRVGVFSGSSAQEILVIVVPGLASGFKPDVKGAGDVNADGFADVVVGIVPSGPALGWVTIYSGAPIGVTRFGSACPGSGGPAPAIGATGIPVVGSTFEVHLSGALGGTTAGLIVGASKTDWWGVPLPWNLALLGMPGCELLVSVDFIAFASTSGSGPGTGSATLGFTIPALPSLVGTNVHAQWYVVDPGPTLLPGAMTGALKIVIQ